jgi:hypothetical protein
MAMLFKRSTGWKWIPDSDEVNSVDGALLRADNTIPEELGSRRLRQGSETLYSGLAGPVHSMYTGQLQGNLHRITGAGDSVYVNGVEALVGLEGVGDLAFVDDSYQIFMARGTAKKKWDGETLHNWGIAAPPSKPTLGAIDAITYTACTFDSTETPALVINEADNLTPVFVPNFDNSNAIGALSLTPNAGSGRASVSKKWPSNQDFKDFLGNIGGQTDLFDIRIWLEEPRKVDKVTIMFGMSSGDDPFLDDYFYFDFNIRNTGTVDVKDAASNSAAAYGISNDRLNSVLTPQEITRVKSPADAGRVLRALGRFAGSRSRERADTAAASPAWGHLSVTRGQFNRVGGSPGRDWKTVRGFKIVYTAIPGTTSKIYLDDAIWTGGGNRALTGSFQVGYRYARRFDDLSGAEVYTELSPMSPISSSIVLQQQTLEVIIPAAVLAAKDAQVNQIWVYLYGGWLDTYYRVAVLPAAPGGGMTIDDLSDPNNLDEPAEWARLASYAFTETTNETDEVPDLRARIFKSELEALIENEIYEAGSVGPPDDIVGVAGPWNKRVFCLTKEGWLYPSSQKCPSSFSLYQTIDLRLYGEPKWVVKTTTGVFVGMSKDIVRIAGSGDNDEQNLLADLYPDPLNVANPPTDGAVSVDGNSVYYRAADGPMVFTGASAQPVPFSGTSMLWKGFDRHAVEALDTINGRFRYEMDDHTLYMLAPEGRHAEATIVYTNDLPRNGDVVVIDTRRYRFKAELESDGDVLIGLTADESWFNFVNAVNVVDEDDVVIDPDGNYQVASAHPHVRASIVPGANTVTLTVSDDSQSRVYLFCSSPFAKESIFESPCVSVWKFYGDEWCRFTYGVNTVMSLFREFDGGLLGGTYEGNVLLLERGDIDTQAGISVEILTPYSEGDSPISRKDPADIQIHGTTGGAPATLNLYTDDTLAPASPNMTLTYSLLRDNIYRANILDLGAFQRVQVEILGSMTQFSIHALGISCTYRPPHVMVLDLNDLIPGNNADLAWISEIEFDLQSDYNVYLDVYKLGELHTTEEIVVTPGIRDVYRVGPLPRETKGRRLGFVLRTSQANGEGFLGFEAYQVRVRSGTTGNYTELELGQTDGRSDQ